MKRHTLGKFLEFDTAKAVMLQLVEKNPSKVYQIRRIRGGFKLVERISS